MLKSADHPSPRYDYQEAPTRHTLPQVRVLNDDIESLGRAIDRLSDNLACLMKGLSPVLRSAVKTATPTQEGLDVPAYERPAPTSMVSGQIIEAAARIATMADRVDALSRDVAL